MSDTPAQKLTAWADRLRDISALGLRFANNVYDREHYEAVQDIAIALMGLATDTPMDEMERKRRL